MKHRSEWRGLGLILLILLAVRLYGITHSPFEAGEIWRQSDTESIAHLFTTYRFDLLHPSFHYDGPLPNVVALELQVTTGLIALLYGAFGRLYVLARLVPILFFLGSCIYLYAFAKRYVGHRGALWSIALFGLYPVTIYFSRSIQPESAALCFYIGALYYFDRFCSTEGASARWLWLAGAFTALAITQKPQTVLIGIPMIGLAWQRYGRRMITQVKLWLFAAGALGLPLLYYVWSNRVAEFHFVEGIATKHILTRFYSDILTPQAWEFFRVKGPLAFTWIGIALFAIAVLAWRKGLGVVYLWVLASVINLVAVVAVIKFYYYMIYLTPPMAVLSGGLLGRLKGRWGVAIPAVLLVVTGVVGFRTALPMYHEEELVLTEGRLIQQLTRPDDLIVVTAENPVLLNAAERSGWRYQLHYYPDIPTDPVAELDYYRQRGAKYLVTVKGYIFNDRTGEIRKYLDAHFVKVEPVKDYIMYDLTQPIS
jgi:4-amino-4-deoxy-L-arabinose transferase-like glycosyltransferase